MKNLNRFTRRAAPELIALAGLALLVLGSTALRMGA